MRVVRTLYRQCLHTARQVDAINSLSDMTTPSLAYAALRLRERAEWWSQHTTATALPATSSAVDIVKHSFRNAALGAAESPPEDSAGDRIDAGFTAFRELLAVAEFVAQERSSVVSQRTSVPELGPARQFTRGSVHARLAGARLAAMGQRKEG